METKFKILKSQEVKLQDGTTQQVLNQVGIISREDAVKAKEVAEQQAVKTQELLAIATRKLALIDESITNNLDYIVL